MRRIIYRASSVALVLFTAILTARSASSRAGPGLSQAVFKEAQIDEPTLLLFQRSCQNCHSENTRWPWYSRIPPASWMIARTSLMLAVTSTSPDGIPTPRSNRRICSRASVQRRAPGECLSPDTRSSSANQFSRRRNADRFTNGAGRGNACEQPDWKPAPSMQPLRNGTESDPHE
jgi:Haem-binding domain